MARVTDPNAFPSLSSHRKRHQVTEIDIRRRPDGTEVETPPGSTSRLPRIRTEWEVEEVDATPTQIRRAVQARLRDLLNDNTPEARREKSDLVAEFLANSDV